MCLNCDVLTNTLWFANAKDFENLTRVNKEAFYHIKYLPEESELSIHKKYIFKKQFVIDKIRKLNPRTHASDKDDEDDLDKFLKEKLDNFNNDFDVMLEVVKKNGRFLRFASDNLKANPKIVLTAVKNGRALEFASEDCRANIDIVIAAVKNRPGWTGEINFASQDILDVLNKHGAILSRSEKKLRKILSNVEATHPAWTCFYRDDDTSVGSDDFYENFLDKKKTFKRPVVVGDERNIGYMPKPHFYHYQHMYVKGLHDTLKSFNINVSTRLTRNQLTEIVRKNIANNIIK